MDKTIRRYADWEISIFKFLPRICGPCLTAQGGLYPDSMGSLSEQQLKIPVLQSLKDPCGPI